MQEETATSTTGPSSSLLISQPSPPLLNVPRHRRDNNHDNDDDNATVTTLATDIGSMIRPAGDAFLKSETIFKPKRRNVTTGVVEDDNNTHSSSSSSSSPSWRIVVLDPPLSSTTNRRRSLNTKKKKDTKLIIDSIEGDIDFTLIEPGDVLLKINGKRLGPSWNAHRAMEYMYTCYTEQGVLSLTVGNDEGDDILVQARIVKSRPSLSYDIMGMVVWKWGVLCIKSIDPHSMFAHTCLKPNDHIMSVNNIDVRDGVSPSAFAHVLNELPDEIIITVKRNKQRWSGKFG